MSDRNGPFPAQNALDCQIMHMKSQKRDVIVIMSCMMCPNSAQVEKRNKNGFRLLPYAKPRVVVQLTLTKIIKIVAN